MKINKKSGFTLLEIIIVIIIVGVLASLALPRLFSTVEYSKSTEALSAFSSVRSSMERCALRHNGDYDNCATFADLDIEDPADAAGNNFTYTIAGDGTNGYTITATNVDGNGTVSVTMDAGADTITNSGTTAYSGVN